MASFPWQTTMDIEVDGTHNIIYIETLGNGNDVYGTAIGDARTGGYLTEAGCLADDPEGGIGFNWSVHIEVEIDPDTMDIVRVQTTAAHSGNPQADAYIMYWTGTQTIGGGGGSNQHTCDTGITVPQSESGTWDLDYA